MIKYLQSSTFSRGKGLKQEKVNCLHFEKIVGAALRVGNIRHLRVFVVLSKPSWAEIVKGVNNEVRYAQTWVMNDVYMYCVRPIHCTLMYIEQALMNLNVISYGVLKAFSNLWRCCNSKSNSTSVVARACCESW